MDKLKGLAIAGAAAIVVIGGVVYSQVNDKFSEPTGPGSGDELTDGVYHDDYIYENTPGSGDELPPDQEPSTGPGSGDELSDDIYHDDYIYENTPGSGDELPSDEPTGPGSGDELTDGVYHDDYIYENTPGSGDELPPDQEPSTGPGSGDEANVVGSCNSINDASTCVDYIGKYWASGNAASLACQGAGTYSTNPCPQPGSGGCQMNAGLDFEMISWFYPYGGDPIAGETINYAAASCNASGGNYIHN